MKSLLLLFLLTGLVGKPLPQWKAGELDIHAINSARGECTFFILPDGTTMVADAGDTGDVSPKKYSKVAPKPDGTTCPAKVYADYMRHFLPAVSRDSIDCFILTHYHSDHMNGVTSLYSMLPFRRILDRSYPDYSDAVRTGGTALDYSFYSDFVSEKVAHEGLKAERFDVGSDSQLGLVHKPDRKFRITNYAAGGYAWDGRKSVDCHATRENAMSCAFLVQYGPFEYWTSGDNNWKELIECTSKAIGHRIEAMKCLHHMSNPEQVKIENDILHPQVIITQSFFVRKIQPHQKVIEDIGDGQDLFFTNIDGSLVTSFPDIYSKCKAIGGHFVIRVCKGGKKFYVYQLDDTSSDYTVKAVYGPYNSN